jgi:NAD(P)-dependent dehydrogenase (short-subunit alcohol dehydrogenase family)
LLASLHFQADHPPKWSLAQKIRFPCVFEVVPPYAASKAALEHMIRCWALELAPLGIRVNAVAAGPLNLAR